MTDHINRLAGHGRHTLPGRFVTASERPIKLPLDVLPALFAVLAFEVVCHGEVSVDFDAVHTLYGRTQEAEKAGMAVTRFCSLVERRGVNRHAGGPDFGMCRAANVPSPSVLDATGPSPSVLNR